MSIGSGCRCPPAQGLLGMWTRLSPYRHVYTGAFLSSWTHPALLQHGTNTSRVLCWCAGAWSSTAPRIFSQLHAACRVCILFASDVLHPSDGCDFKLRQLWASFMPYLVPPPHLAQRSMLFRLVRLGCLNHRTRQYRVVTLTVCWQI